LGEEKAGNPAASTADQARAVITQQKADINPFAVGESRENHTSLKNGSCSPVVISKCGVSPTKLGMILPTNPEFRNLCSWTTKLPQL
jgi:hypothetical protein